MPGDIVDCHDLGGGVILASSGKTPVSDTAERLTTSVAALHNNKKNLAQNAQGAEVEKSCIRSNY